MFLLNVTKSLKKQGVKFAIAGGYAVALHGAIRGTVDVDIVLSLERGQLAAAEKALSSIGLVSRLPITADEVERFREEYIIKRNLVAWSFINPDNPLEVVDIILPEDLSRLALDIKTVGAQKIPIVAIDDLIQMKKKSARAQDLEDVKALEKLR